MKLGVKIYSTFGLKPNTVNYPAYLCGLHGLFLTVFGLGVWTVYWLFPEFTYPGVSHANIQFKGVLFSWVTGLLIYLCSQNYSYVTHLNSSFPFAKQLAVLVVCTTSFSTLLSLLPLNLTQLFHGWATPFFHALNCFALSYFLIQVLLHVPKHTNNLRTHIALKVFILPALILEGGHSIVQSIYAFSFDSIPTFFSIQLFYWLVLLGCTYLLVPHLHSTSPHLLQTKKNTKTYIFAISANFLLLMSFVLETVALRTWSHPPLIYPYSYGIRGMISLVLILQYYKWPRSFTSDLKLPATPKISKAYRWWGTGLWSIPVSCFLVVFWPEHKISWDHLLFADGFLLLFLLAWNTTLSKDQLERLSNFSKSSWLFGFFFLLGMSTRVSAHIVKSYLMHLGVASICILIALGIGLYAFLKSKK